jgi:hypothetical protein
MSEVDALLEKCEEVGAFGDYDYSWWEFKAWYHPEARIYYWYEDAGCSCSYFMEGVDSIGDLSVGRKEELSNAAQEAGGAGADGWEDFKAALRAHKGGKP